MKLTLDLENLENILEEALNKNMDNAIDSAIKQVVAGQIGDKVKIKVYRAGEYKEGEITLGSDELVMNDTVTN